MNHSTNTPDTHTIDDSLACPFWCTLSPEQHLSELTDPEHGAVSHRSTAMALCGAEERRLIYATAVQGIPTEADPDDQIAVLIDGMPDLTVADLLVLSRDFALLAELLEGRSPSADLVKDLPGS